MARSQGFTAILVLAATWTLFGSSLWAAESVVARNPDAAGQFCHVKFPAITEDTLFTDRPVLKDPSVGDFIDSYAPCNYDPLGRAEVLRQRAHSRQYLDKHLHSD